VPENPEQDNLMETFLEHSYVRHRPDKYIFARSILADIETSLLDERGEALARAASPLHLTEFGQAANSTGFSPDSCRSITTFLRTYDIEEGFTRLTPTQRLTALAGLLIRTFGELPEQTNSYLYKVLQPKPRHIGVRSNDLEQVISAWLEGRKEELIFAELPSVRRSSRSIKIQDWQNGFDDQFVWSADFDKFVDFVSGIFIDYLPWLMRACGALSKFTGGQASEIPWGQYADMMGAGVDSSWAVNALLAGAPGSRNIIGMIGRLWPEQYSSDFDPLGLLFIQEPISELNLFSFFQEQIVRTINPEKAELANLYLWLWQQAGIRPRIIS
jgi:helicase